jgi:uncharacterized protein YbaP (TraB family)
MIDRTRVAPERRGRWEGRSERRIRRHRLLLAAALAFALLDCAGSGSVAPTAPAAPVTPLLWRAEPADPALGAFFLLGSVHVGTREMRELGPAVGEAYRLSEELVVEIDLSRLKPREVAALGDQHGRLPASLALRDVVSEPTHRRLRGYLAARGIEPDAMERLEPWLVSMLILQLELEAAGYAPEHGVDRMLIERAARKRPDVALETLAGQLETLDALPPSVQERMLEDSLARSGQLRAETEELIDAWKRGDEALLTELLFGPLRRSPELGPFYESVFFRRNREMAERLARMATDGRTRLVVVGAGHLVGERGIPGELERRGYRVEQVRSPTSRGQ